ncbi:MAG: GNAT family N-acetyltransferase [Shimia sp.]
MTIDVRRAQLSDAPILARLCLHVQAWHSDTYPAMFRRQTEASAFVAHFETFLSAPGNIAWIAWVDGGPEGYLTLCPNDIAPSAFRHPRRTLVVDNIAVVPSARGQGLGSALMTAAKTFATEQQAEALALKTYAGNTQAHRFFARHGFADEVLVKTLPL